MFRQNKRVDFRLILLAVWISLIVLIPQIMMAGFSAYPDQTGMDRQKQKKIITWLFKKLNENYVFPDMAGKMETFVWKQFKKSEYDRAGNIQEFTRSLTSDLRSVCKDGHLLISFNDNPPPPDSAGEVEKEERRKELIRTHRKENYFFREVQNISGNVGYVRFDRFCDAGYAGATAVAAMNILAHCDALIIDLRYNGGGEPSMIQLILSYFFDEPVHYNTMFTRSTNTTEQNWTTAYVQGPKMTGADLYVLTSRNTYSAAEEFTHDLKNLNRATVVGETTGGGAHFVEFYYLRGYDIELKVPIGRSYNPKTGLDWEGIGIEPNVKTSLHDAFQTAYCLALKNLYEKAEGHRKDMLKWQWEHEEAIRNPVAVNPDILKSYAGEYQWVKIKFTNGELYIFDPAEGEDKPMVALSENLFVVDGSVAYKEDPRLEFERDKNGQVTAVYGIIDQSTRMRTPKTK